MKIGDKILFLQFNSINKLLKIFKYGIAGMDCNQIDIKKGVIISYDKETVCIQDLESEELVFEPVYNCYVNMRDLIDRLRK